MSREFNRSGRGTARGGILRALAAVILASALAGGCEKPFQPFLEVPKAPFWMFGYLDLKADTQWVRVTPVRQNLLTNPSPIDAVVTLQKIGSERVVELKDSLFSFTDARLDAVAYAHNFWTTEPLEANARYLLKATRSDGSATVATIDMPSSAEFSFLNLESSNDTGYTEIHADRVLFVEVIHGMMNAAREPAGVVVVPQRKPFSLGAPDSYGLFVDGTPAERVGLTDMDRTELRIAVAGPDWPFDPTLSELDVSVPGKMPTNVENGAGYVGGVETWTIPFHRCTVLTLRPGPEQSCTMPYNARSASVSGRVIRAPCGQPHSLADVSLVERFPDGGAIRIRWRTGWDSRYRFEGIEPGTDLTLMLGRDAPPVQLPRLAPGQRYTVRDLTVPVGC